jgi:hypothetical protein
MILWIVYVIQKGKHECRLLEIQFTPYILCDKDWAQWNSLKVTDDLLESYWESAARQSRITQIVLPPNKVKEIVEELHGNLRENTWVTTPVKC